MVSAREGLYFFYVVILEMATEEVAELKEDYIKLVKLTKKHGLKVALLFRTASDGHHCIIKIIDDKEVMFEMEVIENNGSMALLRASKFALDYVKDIYLT